MSQDTTNALWLIGLAVVLFLLFHKELINLYSNLLHPKQKKSVRPNTPAKNEEKSETAYKIGMATGLMGGDIEDAAAAKYAIERSKGQEKPTDYEIGLGTSIGVNRPESSE